MPTGQVPAVPAPLASFGDPPADDTPSGLADTAAAGPARGRLRRRRLAFGARPEPIPEVPAPSQGAWGTPSVIVRRPDGSVVEPTGRADVAGPRPGGRTAVPAYGAGRRRGAPAVPVEPVVAGIVTATASGAASRAAREDGEAAGPTAARARATGRAGDTTTVTTEPAASERAPDNATGDGSPAVAAGQAAGAQGGEGRRVEGGRVEVDDRHGRVEVDDRHGRVEGDDGRRVEGDEGHDDDEHNQGDDGEPTSDSGRTPAVLRPLVSVGGTVASQATSARAGVVGALRVVRDVGTTRLLPADAEAREALNARLRRAGTYVGAVAVACVLIYAVFPVRTYLDQRAATRRAHEQIEVISEQNDRLAERVEALGSEEEIERIAREEYGMVRPGEESYGVLPPPDPSLTTTTTTATTTTATGAPGGGATPSTTAPTP